MKDHVISGPCSTVQIANPRLPILVTESIENEPRNVDVHRIKARSPQSARFRLHVEYLNSTGIPFGDTMKATIEPRSPSLDTVRTTQVHRYRKSPFWRDMGGRLRKAVRHAHARQRDLRISLGPKHDRGRSQQREMFRQSLPKHALKHSSASHRTRICRCYFSTDREVESLGACPSVQRSCHFQRGIDRR